MLVSFWLPFVSLSLRHLQDPRLSMVVGTNVFLPGPRFLGFSQVVAEPWFCMVPRENEWFLDRIMCELKGSLSD